MALPTADQLKELQAAIVEANLAGSSTLSKCEALYASLLSTVVSAGLSSSAGHVAKAVGGSLNPASVAVAGIGFAGITSALAPWIAAADIARQASSIFELHDLEAAARKAGNTGYSCVCAKCADNIHYIVDRKERDVSRIAVGVATLGVSSIVCSGLSAAKWAAKKWGDRADHKLIVSNELVDSARAAKSCIVAMATIFLLVSNWDVARRGGPYARAVAIICSTDSGEMLKGNW